MKMERTKLKLMVSIVIILMLILLGLIHYDLLKIEETSNQERTLLERKLEIYSFIDKIERERITTDFFESKFNNKKLYVYMNETYVDMADVQLNEFMSAMTDTLLNYELEETVPDIKSINKNNITIIDNKLSTEIVISKKENKTILVLKEISSCHYDASGKPDKISYQSIKGYLFKENDIDLFNMLSQYPKQCLNVDKTANITLSDSEISNEIKNSIKMHIENLKIISRDDNYYCIKYDYNNETHTAFVYRSNEKWYICESSKPISGNFCK